jgi:hypothetical protein
MPRSGEDNRVRTGYDVVLCDLDMPETSQWDAARKTSEFASSPVFFIVTGCYCPSAIGYSAQCQRICDTVEADWLG